MQRKSTNQLHLQLIIWLILTAVQSVKAQFAPQAGFAGSTAMHKDSSAFIAWGKQATVNLGWQNIADTTLGKVNVGLPEFATGKPDGAIISLGDGGSCTITFDAPIFNGPGFDFAVFENGFRFNDTLYFLELASVSVSSDGFNFVGFEPTSLTPFDFQTDAFSGTDARLINNLAGKYIAPFGTPFDLDELKHNPLVNVNGVTHIKITDVVGSILPEFATKDKFNNPINDPWPTAFPSSGFDLDAVGVIHQTVGVNQIEKQTFKCYPNPAKTNQIVQLNWHLPARFLMVDIAGKTIQEGIAKDGSIQAPEKSGIYFVEVTNNHTTTRIKLMVE